MGSEARRRNRSAAVGCALRETRTKLGPSRATLSGSHRSRRPRPGSFPHGGVRGCDHQRSAAEIIYERDVCRSATDRFRLAWLAQTRTRADERAQDQNSHHSRWRGFVRHHFDDAPSAAAGYQRLHGFLHLQGEQATHDNYRSRWSYCSHHRHWSHSSTLQIHLWSSRTAHSRNGNRAVSGNVVVACSCNWTAWIPSWLCRRSLAIRGRRVSFTGAICSLTSVAMGGAGLRHCGHRRAELVVFARHAADRRTSTETEKSLGGRRVHESRARAFRPQSHFRRGVLLH